MATSSALHPPWARGVGDVAPTSRPRTATAPQAGPSFGRALGHLEAGRWAQAFAELAALADGGHPAAARIALTMASRGGLLFGGHFRATARDLARWRQAAG